MTRRLRRLLPNRRGAALIEFALIMPVLIALLLGVGDVAPTTMAKFKSSNAAQSLADLVTQSSELQTSDVLSAYVGALDVLTPFATAGMTMRVSNIASDGNGHAFVYWSCGQSTLPPLTARSNVTQLSNGDSVSTILTLTSAGANTSFVVVDSLYTYTSPAGFIFPSPITMAATSYMLPRNSTYVGFPWNGSQSSAPPVPTTTTQQGSVALGSNVNCNYAY